MRLSSLPSYHVSPGGLAHLQRSRLCRGSVYGQGPIPCPKIKWHNRVHTHIANCFPPKNILASSTQLQPGLLPSHASAIWCEPKAPDKVLITTLTISDHKAVLEPIPSPIIRTFGGNVSKYPKWRSRGYSGWSYKDNWSPSFLGCQKW